MAKQLHRRLNKIKNDDTSISAFADDILSISAGIFQTVHDINPDIEDWSKMKRGQVLMFSVYEMLFLTMHIVNRAIYKMMPNTSRSEFRNKLAAFVAVGLADYLEVPRDEQERDRLKAEFLTGLNDRELEYSRCKVLFKEKNISADDTVIYKGVYRLLGVIYPGDEPFEKNHILAVIKTIDTIFTKLKLDKHLSEFK